MNAHLIAPCGIDCSVCSGYMAYINRLPKGRGRAGHCKGCRPRKKQCAFLKGHCELLRNNRIEFCFECRQYPCARLKHLDERYRQNYSTSLIANLEEIRSGGIAVFMRNQQRRFACAACGGKISMHDKKCYSCNSQLRGPA